jgi:hypothetical protein
MPIHLRLAAALLLCAPPALAVRPFVTDDARITDSGQLEFESWPEFVRTSDGTHVGLNVMAGVNPLEYLQVIFGAGMGLDRNVGISNPVIQPKLLVWRAEEGGFPGLSVAAGLTLPVGRGDLFEPATGAYLIAPITSRLFDDWLLVHVNLGARAAFERGGGRVVRAYGGLGIDLGIFDPDVRLVAEAYTGDPFEALGPNRAFQWGLRWLKSDHVNLDLTFGAQPELDANRRERGTWEYWGQLGIRLLFDVFTPDGRPGDPMGGRGLVEAPARWNF